MQIPHGILRPVRKTLFRFGASTLHHRADKNLEIEEKAERCEILWHRTNVLRPYLSLRLLGDFFCRIYLFPTFFYKFKIKKFIFKFSGMNTYMNTPPFKNKKCARCDAPIYHEKWKETEKIRRERWEHHQVWGKKSNQCIFKMGSLNFKLIFF